MAKKNSTKTATKEALQASEPKLQAFRQWKGINFSEVAPLWNDYVKETVTDDRQTDLPPSYFLVQNNVRTTEQASVEAAWTPRQFVPGPTLHGSTYTDASSGHYSLTVNKLTGVSVMDDDYGYFVCETSITSDDPDNPDIGAAIMQVDHNIVDQRNPSLDFDQNFRWMGFDLDSDKTIKDLEITDMHVYLNRFIAMGQKTLTGGVKKGCIYVTNPDNNHNFIEPLLSGYELLPQTAPLEPSDPGYDPKHPGVYSPKIDIQGTEIHEVDPVANPDALYSAQCTFFYCLTNQFGSTQTSNWNHGYGFTIAYFDIGPSQWTNMNFITISGKIDPENVRRATIPGTGFVRPIGVDIYMIMNESNYPIYVGHADARPETEGGVTQYVWSYDFFGAMTDLAEWSFANLEPPEDNTTLGVPCRYVNEIDGRLYFWGDPDYPYRLYIGGNAGNELSIAVGVGGAFIDIEPGAGTEIKMVEKFKTYGGSSIVTILCSNVNGAKQHRYNLIETNITTTSELSVAGYMVEEIANVVGTTSRHGGGAWSDGLYYINRTGLLVTTQAMEYNSQLRSMLVSSPIGPVFEEQKGSEIANSYLVCINDVIYMATCVDRDYTNIDQDVSFYNNFIWCYDIGLKVWYTLQPTIINGTHEVTKYRYGSHDQVEITETVPTRIMLWPNGLFFYDHEDSVYYGLGVIDPDYGAYVSPIYNNQETYGDTFATPQPIWIETPELGTSSPNTQWQWLCQLEFNFDYFYGDIEIEVNGVDYYGRRMHIVKKVSSPNTELDDHDIRHRVALTAINPKIRVDTLVRYYHITISGHAVFRLNNIIARTYTESKKIGITEGFDSSHYYLNRFNGAKNYMHDAVSCYNNLAKFAYEYRLNGTTPVLDKETATVT